MRGNPLKDSLFFAGSSAEAHAVNRLMSWIQACMISILLLDNPALPKALSPSALATQPAAPPQAMNFTVEGKITQHSPGKLTISTEANIVFHVRYDDKTEIKRRDGSTGSAKDFRPGVKVKIEGELTEAGEVIAQKIEVQQDSPSGEHCSAGQFRPL